MNDHDGCEHCKRLRKAWYSALSEVSESVSRLRVAHKNGGGSKQAHSEMVSAELTAENARMMLDLHRSARMFALGTADSFMI